MTKIRVPIKAVNAADVLFLSDRICNVCTTPGKPVQIHHIDENPSNNELDNLVVLCLDCHNQTMIKGGFGRKLEAFQIRKYRNDWYERVQKRKAQEDEHFVLTKFTMKNSIIDSHDTLINLNNIDKSDEKSLFICKLLNSLPILENAQKAIAETKFNDRTTLSINQLRGHMISFYEEILNELAGFYPKNHFPNGNKEYLRNMITDRFQYHKLVLETFGVGTGGSIVSINCGSLVEYDLKLMIVNFANALTHIGQIEGYIHLNKWREKWLHEE